MKTGICRLSRKIFIEERIYRDIEESETWEAVINEQLTKVLTHSRNFYTGK